MKSYRNLWPRLCDFENLYCAWLDARRGKANKVQVLRFQADLEGNLCSLQDELADGTYRPLPYTNFYVYEKKRRLVSAADLRDRVVHLPTVTSWNGSSRPGSSTIRTPAASARARIGPWTVARTLPAGTATS